VQEPLLKMQALNAIHYCRSPLLRSARAYILECLTTDPTNKNTQDTRPRSDARQQKEGSLAETGGWLMTEMHENEARPLSPSCLFLVQRRQQHLEEDETHVLASRLVAALGVSVMACRPFAPSRDDHNGSRRTHAYAASSHTYHQHSSPMNLHRHALQAHLKGVVFDRNAWLGVNQHSRRSNSRRTHANPFSEY